MTSGAPIMSSQKIGPSSRASRARFCTGAVESSDSMLPTTGFVGGCGMGSKRLDDAIFEIFPLSFRDGPTGPDPESRDSGFDAPHRPGMTTTSSPKPPSPPFDQLGADFFRLFLLRPVTAAANQIFL